MAKKSRVRSPLAALSFKDLQKEINKRVRQADKLLAKRNKLAAKVAALDSQISEIERAMGGSRGMGRTASGGVRKRPHNETNLAEALAAVLKGKTMGPTEATNAVLAAGYKTTAENFRTIVNQTLLKHKKLFKKEGRGAYTAA
ncbi:MAG: hypothetical protein JSR77_13350 [Planctomycetes bacterium]|nr:hypothetical protein [Planctomycetota bacterium]